MFCGRHLLVAKLRKADIDARAGATEEIARVILRIRDAWPEVRVLLRAGSGFAREGLMAWCDANGVDYLLGLAKNERLNAELSADLAAAARESEETGKPARRFKDFLYKARDSWSRERRVVGKAEWMTPSQAEADDATQREKSQARKKKAAPEAPGRGNPRFVVTSLPEDRYEARALYETLYCAPGEMENRIKECQLALPRPELDEGRRPDFMSHHARQSVALGAGLVRLCAGERAAALGTFRHEARRRHLRHDPFEALEDRGASEDQREAHAVLDGLGLSLCS